MFTLLNILLCDTLYLITKNRILRIITLAENRCHLYGEGMSKSLTDKIAVSQVQEHVDGDEPRRQEPLVREVAFCPLPPFYFRRYMGQGQKRAVLTVSTPDGREVRTLDSIH